MKKLFNKYNIIFMVGGSCLYEKSIIEGINYIPKINTKKKLIYRNKQNKKQLKYLLKKIKKEDYNFYKNLKNKKDKRKIIRALEIKKFTKKKFSYFLKKNNKKKRPFNKYIRIGLITDRKKIYKIINNKVDIMIKKGLIEEVKKNYNNKKLISLNIIGYKELLPYIYGKKKLNNCIDQIKKNTRNYAKRQITWFKKYKDIIWFNPKNKQKIVKYINLIKK